MKRFIFLFLFVFFIQINCSFARQRELSKGPAVVFGVDVLLLSIPSSQGNILDVLPIASKIEIIDKASLLTKVGDINDYWYKVKYNDVEGFIWGTLIADYYYENDIDKDGSVETFMVMNLTKSLYEDNYIPSNSRLEFRIARNGQLIIEHKRPSNYYYSCDSIIFKKLAQFSPELNVIQIKYSFSGETAGNGMEYQLFANNNLDSLFSVALAEGEGGYVCYSNIISPNDKGGQTNTIIINTKCADVSLCDDAKGNPCNWEYTKEVLYWDGKKIISKKQ